jgi:D-alanyl-D-alanine carboxypeptidase
MADTFLATVLATLSHEMNADDGTPRTWTITHTAANYIGPLPEFVAAKTGTMGDAGDCLAMVWETAAGTRYISVVLSSDTGYRYVDMRDLIDYAY